MPPELAWEVEVADGKYKLQFYKDGSMLSFRHGEPWVARNLTLIGDKFVYCLGQRIVDLETRLGIRRES